MDKRFCTQCGQPLKEENAFCTNCGHPVLGRAARPGQSSQPEFSSPGRGDFNQGQPAGGFDQPTWSGQTRKKSRKWGCLIAGLLVLFLIFGLIAFIWHSGQEDYTPLNTAGTDHLLDTLGDAP